jgi:hypothetical protein
MSGLTGTALVTGAKDGVGALYAAGGLVMKRRDMMKLMSLVMLPMMPGVAMASSDRKRALLRYKVFTVTRPGLNRDVPPGKESLSWGGASAPHNK